MPNSPDDTRPPIRARAYSLKHAARILAISEHTVQRLCASGQIKSILVSPRRRIIPDSELDRILGDTIPRVSSATS
jgi:predicted site-specific integrase-resolvase